MANDSMATAYYELVKIAQIMSENITDRRPVGWVNHDDFCNRLKHLGVKESPRTLITRVLRPIQRVCLEHNLPDISALIVRRTKGDTGNLIVPEAQWWDPYVESGQCESGDVSFWFKAMQEARGYEEWPSELPVKTTATPASS